LVGGGGRGGEEQTRDKEADSLQITQYLVMHSIEQKEGGMGKTIPITLDSKGFMSYGLRKKRREERKKQRKKRREEQTTTLLLFLVLFSTKEKRTLKRRS